MRKRSTSEVKRRTGADLRAQRDQRLGRPYELQEAGRREASFLKNITGAQDDLEWILTNRAWSQLGFERVADWWQARVVPAAGGFVDLRPSPAMVGQVIQAIVADEAELPKAQRRTQREIASIARVSPATVSRSLHVADETRDDLDQNSGDVDSPPIDVPGPQDSPDALPATSTGLQPATDLEATHPGPDSPADRPLPSDTAEGSTGSVATDQLGIDSSGGPGEAPSSDGAEQPYAAPTAGDEVEGGTANLPSTDKDITEGQAATPPREPVLPSAPAGVSEAGGVEDGPESLGAGLSSTDPASEFMRAVDAFDRALDALDYDVVGPMLTDAELDRFDAVAARVPDSAKLLRRWSVES